MALEISNFEKARRANQAFGGGSYTAATSFEVKAFYTVVDLDGLGTECDAAGYAPIEITNNTTNFPSTTTGIKTLAVAHSSDTFTEDSDDILSFGIFDQLGNLIARKVLSSPLVVENGQSLTIAVSDLTFTVS